MKNKLFLALGVLAAGAALTGCEFTPGGSKNPATGLEGTYDITVWVSEVEGVTTLTEQQIDKFEEENPGIIINAKVEGVSEADSATLMINDVESGADIYCFAQDQLARLVQAGALNRLGVAASETVSSINDAGAVKAATVNDQLYCYPLTSDNGYFMYYDKSIISEDILDSLEDLIAACEAADRMFSFEIETSGWYNASWFFATGCKSDWVTDEAGAFVAANDTFNSEAGLIALQGMQKLLHSKAYSSTAAGTDFEAAVPSAIVVSGTWVLSDVQRILGENFGATDLPSFTVDGQSYHLGSFSGNKLLGVKPQTNSVKNAVLQKLALYLTGEECQQQRFEEFGWGPSNKNVQNSSAVQSDIALSALAKQNQYAIPQGQIHGSWWDISKTYAAAAKEAALGDKAALQTALDSYTNAINGLFSMSTDEKEAFTVIGDVNGWSGDIEMEQKPAGVWMTKEPIYLEANQGLKVRQGKSWDVAYGTWDAGQGLNNQPNYTVAESGWYFVKLDLTGEHGVVSLEKSSPSHSYSVIGSMNGDTNWTIDHYMTKVGEGVYLSDAINFVAGDEYKVRFGTSWDVNYGVNGVPGGDNFKIETAGTYQVKLTVTETSVTVELVAVQ